MSTIFLAAAILTSSSALAASRYWVGGGSSSNWNATGPTNWASTSGGSNNETVPGASDDVFFDASSGSGNSTISADTTIQSLDCTGYTGTLTHNGSIVLTTAGNGVIFKLVAGMTYTKGNNSSTLTFTGTSGTTSLTTGGKSLGTLVVNGTGGTVQLQDTATFTGSANISRGTLDTNNQTLSASSLASSNSNTRSILLGSSTINLSGSSNIINLSTATNLTFNAGTSTINITNSSSSVQLGTQTYYDLAITGNGSATINGAATLHNLTRSISSGTNDDLILNADLTITNLLTLSSSSGASRLKVTSSSRGTPKTITAAAVSVSHTDFFDITGAGATSWDLSGSTGHPGNCGGNTGITFPSPVTYYWVGNGGNFSDIAHWAATSGGSAGSTSPTCGDTARFDANSFSSSGQTVVQDLSELRSDVNFTGITNTPSFNLSTTTHYYGSITLVAGMNLTGTGYYVYTGSGSKTLTTAGHTWPASMGIDTLTGTLTLGDDYTMGSTDTLDLQNGSFSTGNHNFTLGNFYANGATTRSVSLGSSTVTLTGDSGTWNFTNTTNLTFDAGTSTIILTDLSAAGTQDFYGGGLTYHDIWVVQAGTPARSLDITGNNTFNIFKADPGRTITFVSAGSTTIAKFISYGVDGYLVNLSSPSHSFIKSGGGIAVCNYCNISGVAAVAANTWYAPNSSDVGGTTNWLFSDPPAPSAPSAFTAVASGSTINLNWTNPTNNDFSSITIRRSTTNNPSTVNDGTLVASGITTTSYSNNSLADNTYYYSLFALNGGAIASTAASSNATVDTTAPSAVTGLSSLATGSNVALSWTNPISDFDSVTIRRSTSSAPTVITDGTLVVQGLSSTTRADNGLSDGTYYYGVFVKDAFGNVSTVTNTTVTVDTVLPGAPTNVSANLSGGVVTLNWTNPVDSDFDSITIRRSTDAFPNTISDGDLISANLTTTSEEDEVSEEGTYYYSLFAVDLTSNPSVATNVSIFNDGTTPTLITNEAENISATGALLMGAITDTGTSNSFVRGFEYGTTTSYDSTFTEEGSFTTGEFDTELTDLECGTIYHYRAYATNNPGTAYGEDQSFSTDACAGDASDLIISIQAPTSAVEINSNTNFIITIDNPTTANISNTTITFTLSDNLEFVSAEIIENNNNLSAHDSELVKQGTLATCTGTNPISCAVGNISASQSISLNVTVKALSTGPMSLGATTEGIDSNSGGETTTSTGTVSLSSNSSVAGGCSLNRTKNDYINFLISFMIILPNIIYFKKRARQNLIEGKFKN